MRDEAEMTGQAGYDAAAAASDAPAQMNESPLQEPLEPAEAMEAEMSAAEAEPLPHEFRDRPDGEQDPLGEAGWYLEQERHQRGLTLDEAGDATGIHPYHLEAIELGDMACMPGRNDALDMIGAYALFLGFDADPLVAHYAAHLPAQPAPAPAARHPANPAPLTSAKVLSFARIRQFARIRFGRVPGGAGGLVASLAAAVLLFGGASYLLMPKGDDLSPAALQQLHGSATPAAPAADPMPTASTDATAADVTVNDEPMPVQQTASASQPGAAQPEDGQPEDGQTGGDDLAGTGLDGISSLIQQNAAGPEAPKTIGGLASANDVAVTGEGREFGAGNSASRLTLKAKAPVWVRIEDSHGNVVMTQMLMKGDTYRVPNRDGLVVIARDGGLLSYLIDGKEKGILGTPGEILVGRSLDIKSFQG